MSRKIGNLHVFIHPERREKVHIVGDEEGLYRLWRAVEEALISRKGIGADVFYSRAWKDYQVHVLRVETKSNFLKLFTTTSSH